MATRGARNTLKSRGLVCQREGRDTEAIFGFVKANQAEHSVRTMCQVLGVSPSGFYAWCSRPLSARARDDIALTAKLHEIHRRSRGTYGAQMIHAELADVHGLKVGCKRIARLMPATGLRGVMPRRFMTTTIRDESDASRVDLVDRQFKADGPDQLWVADITYIPTWAGFVYLAIVLDVWSRKIVGWAMATHLRTELVLEALNAALMQRRPIRVVHHSDHGCQYMSYAFGKRCQEMGVLPSMGPVGDAFDNTMAESFFATLERELLDRRRFPTQTAAKLAVFEWIEGWYKPHLRHSSLGRISPVNFERRHLLQQAA